jgi:hypothetical protein
MPTGRMYGLEKLWAYHLYRNQDEVEGPSEVHPEVSRLILIFETRNPGSGAVGAPILLWGWEPMMFTSMLMQMPSGADEKNPSTKICSEVPTSIVSQLLLIRAASQSLPSLALHVSDMLQCGLPVHGG